MGIRNLNGAHPVEGNENDNGNLHHIKQNGLQGGNMKAKYIRHQKWEEKEKAIVLHLREPFWGAYKIYHWSERMEGLGISEEAIYYAIEVHKHIRVVVKKYGTYEIMAGKAMTYGHINKYEARDHKVIYVIPRSAFECIRKGKI